MKNFSKFSYFLEGKMKISGIFLESENFQNLKMIDNIYKDLKIFTFRSNNNNEPGEFSYPEIVKLVKKFFREKFFTFKLGFWKFSLSRKYENLEKNFSLSR